MNHPLIHNRGRGPELVGTRTTVYNLLPYFFDPAVTEAYIGKVSGLTPEQVAAARAYVFNNIETVLAEHLRIEERMAAGNPPEVVEGARQTAELMKRYVRWLRQQQAEREEERNQEGSERQLQSFPTFREWVAEQQSTVEP